MKRTVRPVKNNPARIRENQIKELQEQFNSLIEEMTLAKIALAEIAEGETDIDVCFWKKGRNR